VEALPPGSRGERLGLRPGDLILTVNNRPVSARDLAAAVRKAAETPLVLEIRRNGKELRLSEPAAPQGGTP
jgi:S1-C subfamily serine protease